MHQGYLARLAMANLLFRFFVLIVPMCAISLIATPHPTAAEQLSGHSG